MALGFAILCACAARAEPLTLYELLHTQEPGPDVGFLLRQPVGPLTAGDGAYIAADDWDGDGDADLFAGTPYGDLLYFENLGSEANLEYGMAVALRLSAAAVGEEAGACAPRALDWNGDGVTDLLVCRGGRLFVSLSPGIRSSEPLAVQSVRLPGELANGGRACSVQPIDWNADGLLDLIVGTETGRLLLVAGEGSKASHQFASAKPLTADGEAIRLGANAQVCGWEREGATPQALVGSSPGGLRLVRAISAEKPLEAEVVPLTLLAGEDGDVLSLDEPSPAVARGAGGEVILLVGTASGFVEAFAQTGPHEFEHRGRLRQQNAPIDVGRFSAPVLADWDGDTVPDLIVGSDEGSIYFFPGKDPRRGTFFPGHRIEAGGRPIVLERDGGALEAGYAQPLVTDWDSDGDPDLLASGDGGYIWLFENRGGSDLPRLLGGRQVRVGRRPIRQRGPVSMAVHDWNLDGDLDLFVGSGARSHGSRGRTHSPFDGGALVPAVSNGGVVYYENIAASPTLPPRFFKGARLDCKVPVVFPAETIRDAAMLDLGIVGITDWDGDGREDFLLSGRGGVVYLFRTETSHRTYPELELAANLNGAVSGVIVRDAYAASLADANGDGRADLLCGMARYGFVRCYDQRSLMRGPSGAPSLRGPHRFTAVDLSAPIARDGAVTDWRIAIAADNTRLKYRLKILRREGGRLVLVGQSDWKWVKPGWNMFACHIPGVRRGDLVGFASGREGTTTAVVAARAGKTLYVAGDEVTASRPLNEWENADLHLAIEVTVR